MNITRDMIRDLIPVYVEGEATADTVAAVEHFASVDAEIRSLIQAARTVELTPPPQRTPENRKEVLNVTKRLLMLKSIFLAMAIFCSASPFTFIQMEDVSFFLMRDAPRAAAAYALLAIVFWISYAVSRRRLRVAGV